MPSTEVHLRPILLSRRQPDGFPWPAPPPGSNQARRLRHGSASPGYGGPARAAGRCGWRTGSTCKSGRCEGKQLLLVRAAVAGTTGNAGVPIVAGANRARSRCRSLRFRNFVAPSRPPRGTLRSAFFAAGCGRLSPPEPEAAQLGTQAFGIQFIILILRW